MSRILLDTGPLVAWLNSRDAVVITTDRDFLVYRRLGRQAITALMPAD